VTHVVADALIPRQEGQDVQGSDLEFVSLLEKGAEEGDHPEFVNSPQELFLLSQHRGSIVSAGEQNCSFRDPDSELHYRHKGLCILLCVTQERSNLANEGDRRVRTVPGEKLFAAWEFINSIQGSIHTRVGWK